MDSIRQRFLQAWDDFLLILHSDRHLSAFAESWQTLSTDWESCLHEADHETQQLVSEIAGKIEELASNLYLLESRALSLTGDLLDGLEDVFSSLTLEEKTVAHMDRVPVAVTVTTLPPTVHDTISPAQWLLRNLHNPYPPPNIRFSQGRSANSKHVKDWFSKARQRIGWTRLLRDRFAGCRTITTDAAFRAFVRDDPDNPLDDDLKTAFLAIKSHAELVYGDKAGAPSPSPQRSYSISPTPPLSPSSISEDTGHELYPTSPLESSFKRPSKRAFSDSPESSRQKRRRVALPPSLSIQPTSTVSPCTETSALRSRKRHLSDCDSDYSRSKRPRGVEDGRLHTVSDSLSIPTKTTCIDLDQTFKIPNPVSTSPPDTTSFYLDFFNPPSFMGSSDPSLSTDITASTDTLNTLSEISQLYLLQPSLPSFDCDWNEFLNFEPDLSLFQPSPSLTSSLAGTPPLTDDATLSPPSLPDSGLSSPDPLCILLPHLTEKGTQFPIFAEPVIREQDFLLHPGDVTGIPSADVLFAMH